MKIGVIGYGSIGARHAKNLKSLGEKVIVCDPRPAARNAAEKDIGVDTMEDSDKVYEACDAVVICVPTTHHFKHLKNALEHGCHVFIEKPLSTDLQGIQELAALVKKKNLHVFVACNMRFHPAIQKIKELLDANLIGTVYSVLLDYGYDLRRQRPDDDQKMIAKRQAAGGGIVLDAAVHEIDYLSWLFGTPTTVTCTTGNVITDFPDLDDIITLAGTTNQNTYFTIVMDYHKQTKRRGARITGSTGSIEWRSIGKNPEHATVTVTNDQGDQKTVMDADVLPNEMYLEEMQCFLEQIRGEREPFCTIEQGALALATVLAATASISAGKDPLLEAGWLR